MELPRTGWWLRHGAGHPRHHASPTSRLYAVSAVSHSGAYWPERAAPLNFARR